MLWFGYFIYITYKLAENDPIKRWPLYKERELIRYFEFDIFLP